MTKRKSNENLVGTAQRHSGLFQADVAKAHKKGKLVESLPAIVAKHTRDFLAGR